MDSKIKEILKKIDQLNQSLSQEHKRLAEKYGFSFEKRKIIFLEKFRKRNKAWRIPSWKYALPPTFRHLLSIPFIYSMIIPTIILDIFTCGACADFFCRIQGDKFCYEHWGNC